VAKDRVTQGVDHVAAVPGGGGEVSADAVAIAGALFTGEASGDLLLNLAGAQIAFGLVRGGWHPQVLCEAQHVGLAVAQDFQEQAGLAFTGTVAVAGAVGQPDLHPVLERLDQRVADGGLDGALPGVAGAVGLVDQAAQRVGDLGRPVRVGVGLGRAGEIAGEDAGRSTAGWRSG
jgi:hypothetical protein